MSPGFFITLEGGEGTGKSTQSALLASKLEARSFPVLQTREPGGSPAAEAIRNLLVNGNPQSWSPVSEALLVYAARDDHLRRVIVPAIDDGKFVICDRFIDSTWAYQGVAGGVDAGLLALLETHVVGKYAPDLTLIFDLDAKAGLARATGRGEGRGEGREDRFEAKGLEYHQKIRQAFLEIAQKNPQRCMVVDASQSVEDIETRVWQIVADRFLKAMNIE